MSPVLSEQVGEEVIIGGVGDERFAQVARVCRSIREIDFAVYLGSLAPPTTLQKEVALVAQAIDQDVESFAYP